MGLYRYDQWGCLPDGVVVGYCPSVGYSTVSLEAEPTTKDTTEHNHHMATCNNMMHAMTWQYGVSWLMHCKQVGLSPFDSKIQMKTHDIKSYKCISLFHLNSKVKVF